MASDSYRLVPLSRRAFELWIVAAALVGGVILLVVLMWPDKFAGYRSGDMWGRFDLLLGVVAAAVLPLRHRHPRLVTFPLVLSTALAISTVFAAIIAVVTLTTNRRRHDVTVVLMLWIPAGLIFNAVHSSPYRGDLIANSVITVLTAVCAVATGAFLGARRDALANLTQRLEAAEQQQAIRAEKAIADERARIARELHDVVAHRISLIALHSGALAVRPDMREEDQHAAAEVIRSSSRQALNELREVLGVLRPDDPDGPVQPRLDALPRLIADNRSAGVDIEADIDLPDEIHHSTSFHAYRIVQECLTNAAKHAPGEVVHLSISQAGQTLRISMSNAVPEATTVNGSSSGLGLIGLTERARLSGGSLKYGISQDQRFYVTAWLAEPRSR